MLTLIAAAAENNELGKDNDLIWHLPKDFKHFKNHTSGHCIIMGRKTFESLPGLLPKRKHIIITRQKDYKSKGCIVSSSLDEAIKTAYEIDENPFVIGGGEIYNQAINIADVILLTRVHTKVDADTFFPDIDENIWELKEENFHSKDSKHQFDFTFLFYKRKV